MRGEEAAQLFYTPDHFIREGAAPRRVQKTLFGQGGVQGLDDEAHRCRKHMFMALMTPEHIKQLADLMVDTWHRDLRKWERMDEVVFFDEVRELLCRTVCTWAGIPLSEAEVEQRTNELGALIDGAGTVGPRHWRARQARRNANQWIGQIVEQVRTHALESADGSALHVVAWHRDPDGRLLDKQVAAVELLNLLRPTLAVARYITFSALALHEHPEYRQQLQAGGADDLDLFVQEVRRYYPFFPLVAARVRETFDWNGYQFPQGVRVLLDLYVTNHHPVVWERPEAFRPERFQSWDGSAFNFIPQGGGDYDTNHRCPGEWITIELMKVALRLMTRAMAYHVPEQNLQIRMSRIPALPQSRFIIQSVRQKEYQER